MHCANKIGNSVMLLYLLQCVFLFGKKQNRRIKRIHTYNGIFCFYTAVAIKKPAETCMGQSSAGILYRGECKDTYLSGVIACYVYGC